MKLSLRPDLKKLLWKKHIKYPPNDPIPPDASKTLEYKSWNGMISRCYRVRDVGYRFYGDLGIKVCNQWRHSFQTFLKDMGPRPTPKHTLDRIDPTKGYEPRNCRWATPKQQCENRRKRGTLTELYRQRYGDK